MKEQFINNFPFSSCFLSEQVLIFRLCFSQLWLPELQQLQKTVGNSFLSPLSPGCWLSPNSLSHHELQTCSSFRGVIYSFSRTVLCLWNLTLQDAQLPSKEAAVFPSFQGHPSDLIIHLFRGSWQYCKQKTHHHKSQLSFQTPNLSSLWLSELSHSQGAKAKPFFFKHLIFPLPFIFVHIYL